VKQFLKGTAMAASAVVGAMLAYEWISGMRVRLERGLERVERVAENAQDAVAHTQQALGETAQTVRQIRQGIS
jgi:hypothetical protein